MKIELADSYGFCFGVKRAIRIAENTKDSATYGELIHNAEEIKRLKEHFNVKTLNTMPVSYTHLTLPTNREV